MKKIFSIIIYAFTFSQVCSFAQPTSINAIDGVELNKSDDVIIDSVTAYIDSLMAGLYPHMELVTSDTEIMYRTRSLRSYQSTTDIINPAVPSSVSIDTSKSVGEIPIHSAVSPTGSKTYEIPIEVPAGMNGFTPSVSLTYDSHRGNSIAGMGWDISGLSKITRTHQSIYYDGQTSAIGMTKSDAFTLDGSRLIKLNQMTDYILYESETGNIKVKGYFTDDVINYFEVFFPDGRIGVYGEVNNNDNQVQYPLMSLSDIHGNTIAYSYISPYSTCLLTAITYNGASVLFGYESFRPDEVERYVAGQRLNMYHRINSITCRTDNYLIRTYSLSYAEKNGKSYLTELGLSAGNASLPSLKFYYGTGAADSSYTQTAASLSTYYQTNSSSRLKTAFGHFDYVNNTDGLIVVPYLSTYVEYNSSSKKAFENQYNGDEELIVYTSLNDTVANSESTLTTEPGFIDVLCADLDGTQNEYIVKINNSVVDNLDQVTFKVYRMSLSVPIIHLYTRTFSFPTVYSHKGYKSVQPKSYYVGDFNGDGKMEIMAVSAHQPFGDTSKPSMCYIFDLPNNQILYQGHFLDYNQSFIGQVYNDPKVVDSLTDKLFVFDCNGDGKSDLCHVDVAGTKIYNFNTSAGLLAPTLLSSCTTFTRGELSQSKWTLGDFNGDGLMDVVKSPSCLIPSGTWFMFKSRGDGTFTTSAFDAPAISDYDDTYIIALDVNGDGYSDLLRCDSTGIDTYLCKYNTFSSLSNHTTFSQTGTIVIPININSRNTFTEFAGLKSNRLTWFEFQRNDRKEQLLTGMINSLGVIEKNEYLMQRGTGSSYVLMPADNELYTPTYPYIKLHEPLPLLYRTEHYKDGEKFNADKYGYGTAVYHRQGLGFRGFRTFVRNDYRNRLYSQTFDVERFSVPISTMTPTSETDYTFSVDVQSNKRALIRMTGKDEEDLMTGVTASTAFSYDTYGNPTAENTTYSDGTSTSKYNVYSNHTSVANGYHLGCLSQTISTTNIDGSSYTERYYVPTFNSAHQPIVEVFFKNGYQVKEIINSYDSCGNVLSESVKLYSSPNRQLTSYAYNSNGLLTSETDPTGNTTTYNYNYKRLLSSTIDQRGNSTIYSYDDFGRLTQTNLPDGTLKATLLSWNGDVSNAVYALTDSVTGKPVVKKYFDALNRELRHSDQRFDGTLRHVDKLYDSYGRLFKVSLPYKGSTPLWNTYAYDDYDRTTSVNEPSGRTTTYSYSGLSTTTTEDGIATTRTYDVLGNLAEVEDPAGTITYEMAADGQPISITAPGSIATSFTYDQYRRRTSIIDPSAGTTSYTYDSAGNTASETNANGQTTTYAYDQYNRLVTTTYPEMTVTRVYGSYGDLTNVNSSNGVSRSMTYDNYGRLSSWKETADSVWLQKDYSYSSNNLSSVSYTSHKGFLATENYTYANGTLTTISKNGTLPIFQLTQENMLGLPTGVTTLNLTRTYSFSQTGLPTGRTAAGPSATIMNESYSFDAATSNLLSRTDNLRNLTEQFTYDNLNRLTSHDGATVQFDLKGNITGKSNVGTFTYTDTQKPYALTGANAMSGTISTNTQDITFYSFPRPKQIAEGAYSVDFAYDGDLGRVKEEVKQGNSTIEVRYTLGGCYDYIINGQANLNEEDLYLAGGYYDAPMLMQRYGDGSSYISHLVRDYQGSIVSIVDSTGFWHNDYSYDAWGRPRNPQTHTVYNPSALNTYSSAYRGYCGHEHLPQFGLINMNARLYDPALGRFLSPDPYVQMPDFSQSFNRYSYCLNNPLKYVDENGEYWWILISAGIGGFVNLGIKAAKGKIHSWGDGFAAFGIGFAAGAVSAVAGFGAFTAVAGVGATVGTGGFFAGAASGAVSGLAGASILSVGNHQYFGDPQYTWKEYAWAIGLGGLAGGASNGMMAVFQGKNFWTGEAVAAGRSPFAIKNVPVRPSEVQVDIEGRSTIYIESNQPHELYHYTSEKGYKGIIESNELLPSSGIKNARYGDGQYFTDIRPSDYTIHQASRRLYGMPFNTTKMQYYLKLDVRGIDLINTAPHIYLHPSSTPLNIQYRITEGGISIFKIKF